MRALANPNVHLKAALQLLLETNFAHAIDAPALSLLVPILDHGLMMHDNETKHLASHLMGNICQLTSDPKDLLPYMKILMPAIKNSLFDSIPDIRASASKALGSLSKGLGVENSKEIIDWLYSVLNTPVLQVSERSGAAQGLAEIASMLGVEFLESVMNVLFEKSRSLNAYMREGYRGILVFLPGCYPDFVDYLPKLLPLMIEGLSDQADEVRKVSLINVKICIKNYGRLATAQLVTPILTMMFDKDFQVRKSSAVLMYQLIKELENDIGKLQPKFITVEQKNSILASLFILKYDTVERVAT